MPGNTRLFAMIRRPALVVAALATTGMLLGACTTKVSDPTAGWSPNRIYSEARDDFNAGAFDKAIPLYEKLEGRAAGTSLAQQAQLDKAYAQYRDEQREAAIATLDRFMRLHPASPAVDYALYLKGLINFNDNLGLLSFLSRQDLSERDQKAAKLAFESFQELTTRFPESRYAEDARQRMRYIVNALAQYEVHVARYYYTRGAYVAAIDRAQQALRDYHDAPALEEALLIMAESYDALDMPDLRDDTRRVLEHNYPGSQVAIGGSRSDKPWWQFW